MVERNNYFLFTRMNNLWENHFNEISRKNPIQISFGRKTKTRLGSIKYTPQKNISLITINDLLSHQLVPICVVDSTISHELIHYIHGFSSSHERKFNHPHQGGIILKEMKNRGLYQTNLESKRWLRTNWHLFISLHLENR